jgi:hypothetical protein
VLILDMIEVLPPLGKYKYNTWRILPMKCYIDNSVRLWSFIRNVNTMKLTTKDGMELEYEAEPLVRTKGATNCLRFNQLEVGKNQDV